MKLIKPSIEILEQFSDENINNRVYFTNIFKHIEIIGRTCYKSEDKMTDTSAKDFVEMLINKGHTAMLEHGTVYLKIPASTYGGTWSDLEQYYPVIYKYIYNKYSKVNFEEVDEELIEYYISTNYRVLLENNWLNDLQYIYDPTQYHEKRISVRFICDRGVSHELVRHRAFSFAQESTRYVSSSTKLAIKEFNLDTENGICEAYKNGWSMKSISESAEDGINEWGVRKILFQNKIPIRGLNNRGYKDNNFFKEINSPEKAYLLGLIQTDGNVQKNSFSITQHKDYYWYIDILLHQISNSLNDWDDKNCKQVSIHSKEIVKDLISLGIVPNKTEEQTDGHITILWDSIPEQYKNSFIRGLIDGDGHVSFRVQEKGVNESPYIGFCSVKENLVDLIIDYIQEKFDYKCGKDKDKSVFKLRITNFKKSIEIGNWLFQDFKYPFGHPKKSAAWISRLNKTFDFYDYGDEKFKIIKPLWLDDSSEKSKFLFTESMWNTEQIYSKLRSQGWQPQQARAVLPNSLKTEVVMTGFVSDWKHFFELRTAPTAHPQMRELAIPLKQIFEERSYL